MEITTLPYDARGYAVGETIGVQVTFSEAVAVSGTPVLRLGIGANARDAAWAPAGSVGGFLTFRYRVTVEDRDEDGMSIGKDALRVGMGMITSAQRVAASLDLGDHAIVDDGNHLVLGRPPAMPCRDERVRAVTGRRLPREWEGTPFPVHLVRNFPEHVSEEYLEAQLDAIGRVAEQIEEQLGYRIIERGDLIDVPAGTPNGWDQNYERYWRNNALRRRRGEIWLIYLNDESGHGGSMSTHHCCGTVSYNRSYFEAPHWTEQTGPGGPDGQRILHMLFLLFGFVWDYDPDEPMGVAMSEGALNRPWATGASTYYVTWTDIENLRCMYPDYPDAE